MNGTVDVKEVLLKMGYVIHLEDATHYRMRPLYRDSDNNTALEVDKSSGLWYDFVERAGGSLDKLIELTMHLPPEKVSEFLENKTISSSQKDKYELEEIKQFDKSLLLKLRKDHSYWIGRGIKEHTISLFEGGTTNNGRMKNRYVFPIFNERDDLVGFSGRNLGSFGPKWKHIGRKSSWCYPLKWNHKFLQEAKTVILLESIGDMLSLWEAGIKNTLVTFGVTISPAIIQYLLKLDAQKILIAFNNDYLGNSVGNEAAEESRIHLLRHFDPHQIVVALPEAKDFGEMNPKQIKIWTTQHLQN